MNPVSEDPGTVQDTKNGTRTIAFLTELRNKLFMSRQDTLCFVR